ncbi:MAG: polysaccharide deacetylase family protein [Kiritimatiellales bacterium]
MNESKTIALTFDDAVSNHATLAGPLLRRYGFGATFYICEFPPDFSTNKQQYMTWEQIQGLDEAGFEIGNHTLTHANIAEMDDAELVNELELVEKRCAEHGITHPVTFAYPSCHIRESAFPVLLQKGYRLARIGGSRSFIPGQDHPLLVPSFPVHGDDKSLFYNAVAQASPGVIPVLMFHGIPEYTHPWVNTPPELFTEYIHYLAANDFRVIAMRDLLPGLESEAPAGIFPNSGKNG